MVVFIDQPLLRYYRLYLPLSTRAQAAAHRLAVLNLARFFKIEIPNFAYNKKYVLIRWEQRLLPAIYAGWVMRPVARKIQGRI